MPEPTDRGERQTSGGKKDADGGGGAGARSAQHGCPRREGTAAPAAPPASLRLTRGAKPALRPSQHPLLPCSFPLHKRQMIRPPPHFLRVTRGARSPQGRPEPGLSSAALHPTPSPRVTAPDPLAHRGGESARTASPSAEGRGIAASAPQPAFTCASSGGQRRFRRGCHAETPSSLAPQQRPSRGGGCPLPAQPSGSVSMATSRETSCSCPFLLFLLLLAPPPPHGPSPTR